MERKLNVDVAGAITEFEEVMREFEIVRIIYKIIFRGKGLEFDSFRDFSADDDASDIDWKSSVKANKLLVKQYIEERDLKIVFVIDVGDNMLFGSTEKLKCEYITELSTALAHLILKHGDNIGFVLFSDRIVKNVEPGKSRWQFNMMVNDLSNPLIYGGKGELRKTLDFLLGYLDESINSVIIVSDFLRLEKNSSEILNLFASKFETMAIMVKDPLDKTMPEVKEEIVVEDPITKEQLVIDPSVVKKSYEKNALEQEKMVKRLFKGADIDLLDLTTDKPFASHLAEFLKGRIEKRKYITPTR